MLIFRQLVDPQSSTYTYLLGDGASRAAVLIDPVFEQVRRDVALIDELGLKLVATLETHVHADHVTGASLLRQRSGAKIMVGKASGAVGADRYLVQDDIVSFGGRRLLVRATPGHTGGCLTYVLDDHSMAFTGDCLLIRGSGRTDFQEGDPGAMYRSVREQIFALPPECLLYPAHDYRGLTVTSVAEERRYNPRLGGDIAVGDFTGYMANLRLAHPKMIDVAVPANLRCGQPEGDAAQPGADPGWGHLRYSFAGVWEIDPHGLEELQVPVQILDVREEDEFTGPLGHPHSVGPARHASRRTGPRPADRRGVPRGQPFGPGGVDPPAGGVRRDRQSQWRDAALARRGLPCRRRQRVRLRNDAKEAARNPRG
jgi:sulfur dioxygenase